MGEKNEDKVSKINLVFWMINASLNLHRTICVHFLFGTLLEIFMSRVNIEHDLYHKSYTGLAGFCL